MQYYPPSPLEIPRSLSRNRALIWALTKREVLGRYRGSVIGLLWSFLNPLIMLAVYTFVFGTVFKVRWTPEGTSTGTFALVLFAGMLIFNIFSECATKAPTLLVNNPNFVKKIVFPLEILPFVTVGVSLFHFLVSLLVWLLFYVCLFGIPNITIALIPVIVIPLSALILGITWCLAALGVYVKDTTQIIGNFVTIVQFATPIFYPLAAVPQPFQSALLLNPLTVAVEAFRGLLLWGTIYNLYLFGMFVTLCFIGCCLGFVLFQRVRPDFSEHV